MEVDTRQVLSDSESVLDSTCWIRSQNQKSFRIEEYLSFFLSNIAYMLFGRSSHCPTDRLHSPSPSPSNILLPNHSLHSSSILHPIPIESGMARAPLVPASSVRCSSPLDSIVPAGPPLIPAGYRSSGEFFIPLCFQSFELWTLHLNVRIVYLCDSYLIAPLCGFVGFLLLGMGMEFHVIQAHINWNSMTNQCYITRPTCSCSAFVPSAQAPLVSSPSSSSSSAL